MSEPESFRDQSFLDDVYKESYSHYRHLEILRKDHLNIFLVINAALIAILSTTNGVGAYLLANHQMAALGLIAIIFIAFVFYFISRIGEEAKYQHGFIMEEVAESRLGSDNIYARAFRGRRKRPSTYSARVLDRIGIYRVSTLMLLPYLLVMWLYVIVAVIMVLRALSWPIEAITAVVLFGLVVAVICTVLCTLDFLGFAGRREIVPTVTIEK